MACSMAAYLLISGIFCMAVGIPYLGLSYTRYAGHIFLHAPKTAACQCNFLHLSFVPFQFILSGISLRLKMPNFRRLFSVLNLQHATHTLYPYLVSRIPYLAALYSYPVSRISQLSTRISYP